MTLPLHKLRLPAHVDPLSMDVGPYAEHVRQRNDLARARSEALLEAMGAADLAREIIGDEHATPLALVANGSDGRKENCASPLEPILLVLRSLPDNVALEVRARLNGLLASVSGYTYVGTGDMHGTDGQVITLADAYDPIVEMKMLEQGDLSRYRDEQNVARDTWPSRIIDIASMSEGAEELIIDAKRRMCAEILGPGGKKMYDRERERLRDHLAICRPGDRQGSQMSRGERLVHFDLREGVAHYTRNDDAPDVRSFKYGPLRMVQHLLVAELLRAMRERSKDALRLLQQAPTHTADKLAFLSSEGVLRRPHADVQRTAHFYLYFLQLYHFSEFHFVITRQKQRTVELPDPQEAGENLKELVRLVELLRGKTA